METISPFPYYPPSKVMAAKRQAGEEGKCPCCLQRDQTHAMAPCGHQYCGNVSSSSSSSGGGGGGKRRRSSSSSSSSSSDKQSCNRWGPLSGFQFYPIAS